MLRSLVGSEMCIRDRYQRRVRETPKGHGCTGSEEQKQAQKQGLSQDEGKEPEPAPAPVPKSKTFAKIVIVGDTGVGKTCLLDTMLNHNKQDWSQPQHLPTAAANHTWKMEIFESLFELEVWDTAGQECLKALRVAVYPDAKIYLLAYDMTRPESLEHIEEVWLPEIMEEYEQQHGPLEEDEATLPFDLILVGCKEDKWEEENAGVQGRNDPEHYHHNSHKVYQQHSNFKAVVHTSAKTGHGVRTTDGDELLLSMSMSFTDGTTTLPEAIVDCVAARNHMTSGGSN
eukprot:TRINITY_DN4331_c0_g1_i15.p1 TRINITY_DN4331_c0_g1~~TRINITY_DN4331_c0_g1_i15.p1  ORF type:complete len:286 (-),score=64.21 TRINITY_DN4331_c0_g1_i15:513-1370(-)